MWKDLLKKKTFMVGVVGLVVSLAKWGGVEIPPEVRDAALFLMGITLAHGQVKNLKAAEAK